MNPVRLLRRARPMQVGFLVLLTVCTAQLAYWLLDEVRYTRLEQTRLEQAYEAEVEGARAALRAGVPWSEIARSHPEVVMGADSATLSVDEDVLAALGAERFHRLNRFAWEGAFFLAVLLASMAMVYRTVRAEAELRQRQDEFLAAASHELKSPLASLRLSVETLAMRDPSAERRAELVRRLLADLGRLQRMIANILDTSRLSTAEMRSAPERVVLADEVSFVMGEMHEQAVEGTSRVRADIPSDLVVFADPEGVRTVVRNLLHNAMRATNGNGEVDVRASGENGVVRLEVRDSGVGFPPREARRLFDKFYRVGADPRTRAAGNGSSGPSGTGLGLYIVRRTMELDGGAVAAESAGPGQGARFVVTWPAATELAP